MQKRPQSTGPSGNDDSGIRSGRSTSGSSPNAQAQRTPDEPESMTEDGKSIVAGSGNTLGDGRTAGGDARTKQERGTGKS